MNIRFTTERQHHFVHHFVWRRGEHIGGPTHHQKVVRSAHGLSAFANLWAEDVACRAPERVSAMLTDRLPGWGKSSDVESQRQDSIEIWQSPAKEYLASDLMKMSNAIGSSRAHSQSNG